ncbi:MAG TPA: 4-(cytidine 5'-diphospho)-2-C-methyl-D-erythritol kinase [Puia sp.]|nr:4-(cytidine 5'-diphospho)-2-C-methyl-D-erythritol kinase [Puia sp.]
MISFPNCKINLGLQVLAKRRDGFHDISSIIYPLKLYDVLEIVPGESFMMNTSGYKIAGEQDSNLCIRAYHLLKDEYPDLPPVHIFLHKGIPIGAGMGGGSADGTFSLILLNKFFELGLSPERLKNYSLQLGSDCPFFVVNKPCLVTGRGEILQQIELDLSEFSIVVVFPGIHIDTKWAYSSVNGSSKITSLPDIASAHPAFWKGSLLNDFEEPVLRKFPELRDIKDTLYRSGAMYASMTGSGSSFFGIFEKNQIPQLPFKNRFPLFRLP